MILGSISFNVPVLLNRVRCIIWRMLQTDFELPKLIHLSERVDFFFLRRSHFVIFIEGIGVLVFTR